MRYFHKFDGPTGGIDPDALLVPLAVPTAHLCANGPLALALATDLSHTWSRYTHGLYVVDFALSHCMSRVRGAAAKLYSPCTTFTSV
jgi:hypothetical protein